MIELWLVIIGLLLIAVIILLLPLIKPNNSQVNLSEKQQNIDIFKQRLAELEQEKNQNNVSDETFLQLKLELEKSLLMDVETDLATSLEKKHINSSPWLMPTIISLLVIGISLGIYFKLGRSDDYGLFLTMETTQTGSKTNAHKNKAPGFEKMIASLEQKLQKNPEDTEKWLLLANSYSAIGKFDKATQAFTSIIKQMPVDDPNLATVKGSYAQMLFQAAGEVVTYETEKLMSDALALDPLEPSALIIKGIKTYTTGDLKGAIVHWEKAKTKAAPEVLSRFIEPVIAQTYAQLGEQPTASKPLADIASARIEVKLDILADLKVQTKPDDIIFIFAQKSGGRMPLAADRLQVKDLPTTLILDDSKSPMPAAKLSSAEFVDITARVSFAGHPKASKGDFFNLAKKVAVNNSSSINIVINQTVK